MVDCGWFRNSIGPKSVLVRRALQSPSDNVIIIACGGSIVGGRVPSEGRSVGSNPPAIRCRGAARRDPSAPGSRSEPRQAAGRHGRGQSSLEHEGAAAGAPGRTEVRVLFAFDRERKAILLLGGDKSRDWSGWYRTNIPVADARFDEHQARIVTKAGDRQKPRKRRSR